MSCRIKNLTKEEVFNALSNRIPLFKRMDPDISRSERVAEIVSRCNAFNAMLEMPDPLQDGAKYTVFGRTIEKRISDIAKESHARRLVGGKAEVIKRERQPDAIKKKRMAAKIHMVLSDLMNAKIEGKKDLTSIKFKAASGEYKITGDDIAELVALVDDIYDQIQNEQKLIDPKGKAHIFVNQRILDPITGRGGTIDLFVVFSDGSAAIFDYKALHSTSSNYKNGVLIDDLIHDNTLEDYELSMAEYKRQVLEILECDNVKMCRLVPIHFRLTPKPYKDQRSYDFYSTTLQFIETGVTSSALSQIPVAGEMTKYAGINELLIRQGNILKELATKLRNSTSAAERDRIRQKIKILQKAMRKAIVRGRIIDLIETAKGAAVELRERLKEPEYLPNNTPNPDYPSVSELKELLDEVKVYANITKDCVYYFNDLKEESPEEYEELRKALADAAQEVDFALKEGQVAYQERAIELIAKEYKDSRGKLKPYEELDFFTRNFTRISDINNPFFKAAWKLIEGKLYDQREELEKIYEEVLEKDEAVARWAKKHGMSRLDAFKKIINFSTGELIDIYSNELYRRIDEIYINLDVEAAYKELTKIFEIRDKEWFAKDFERRFERQKELLQARFKDNVNAYVEALQQWYNNNNLLKSKQAWSNKFNRRYLKYREDIKQKYYSEEYKELLKPENKPLLDYYNMYIKYNEEFGKILNTSAELQIPYNFIANIRKTMIESIAFENASTWGKYILKEFIDSFNVRQDDVYITDVTATGERRRVIPVYFVNPLRNKNGDVDLTLKSYDLSKNLLLFAKSALNYKNMSEIEAHLLALRDLMAMPQEGQGGVYVTDTVGRKVKNYFGEYATQAGLNTDTYKLFTDMIDYYLYGIKFKTEHGKLVKTLLKLKQYHSKKTLSFAVIPGLGALLAGNISALIEGSKGISYTKKNVAEATKNMITNPKKYLALSKFFEPYQEDPMTKYIERLSAHWATRWLTTRNMFFPLRRADELMTDALLNRMALNWGIDTKTKKLVRMNRVGVDLTNVKSIWELAEYDEKTGEIKFDPELMTKENYIRFRNATRKTLGNIIGSLSQEEISRIDLNLLFNLMFHYRSWMPAFVRERTGKLQWDDHLDAVRWGRFRAAFSEFNLTEEELRSGYTFHKYLQHVFLPSLGKLVLDLLSFGFAHRIGLTGGQFVTSSGKIKRVRSNIDRARLMYNDWLRHNPELADKVSFEEFIRTKEGQTAAALNEVRVILSFMLLFMYLGGGDDDESPRYMRTWTTRTIYKTLSRANSELTFMWNPAELVRLFKNPVPITMLLSDVINILKNTFDEGRDVLFGENEAQDRSPQLYYLLQMMYGGPQIIRLVELYDVYKQSPY